MKLGLLTVTFAGLFYDGRALALSEQIARANELGFEGLSIEAKRPVASPLDLDPQDPEMIRPTAREHTIELCALKSMSNFGSPFMEQRENNLAMMQQMLGLADAYDDTGTA